MATKLQLITELSERTAHKISNSPADWTSFLKTAAWNYKYPFQDQLLIYAQRPDATACAPIEAWNQKLYRWVKKGAKGIALIDDSGIRLTLRHVFDVSDTTGRYNRPVMLWKMEDRYSEAVMETLENAFGELEEKQDMAEALIFAADNAVEDNFPDYLSELMDYRDNSFLEELDDLNVEVIFKDMLKSSVAYMLLVRCGYNADEYLHVDDFINIFHFNTMDIVSRLGAATGDISGMILREIGATVKELQRTEKKQNRTVAKKQETGHNESRKRNDERTGEHGTDLHDAGRLPDTRPGAAGGSDIHRQIWDAAQDISEGSQERDVRQPGAVGQARQPSVGDRQDGEGTHRTDNGEAPEGQLSAGQGGRPYGLDGPHEQPETFSGGNSAGGTGVQLNLFPTERQQIEAIEQAEDEKSSAFSISQEDIDYVLCKSPGFHGGKFRIYQHYQEQHTQKETISFLKQEYGTGGSSHSFLDGTRGHEWHDSKGITLSRFGTITPDLRLSWIQVAKRIGELIAVDRYFSSKEKEQLPAMLQKMEERRQKLAEEAYAREILNREPTPADQEPELSQDIKKYAFHLGDTVYLGAQGYEICSFNAQSVELRDKDCPLFTKQIQREAFEQMLRENPLNDHLVQTGEVPEQPAEEKSETLSPRALYQKYLPEIIRRIQADEVYPYLRDRETDPDYAKLDLDVAIDSIVLSMQAEHPAFYEAYTTLPQFKEWLAEDVFQRTYEDYPTNKSDSVTSRAGDSDAPEWARETGEAETKPAEKEIVVGMELSIEDRRFCIDEINAETGTVSLRDITFQQGTGFPIFRRESIEFVHSVLEKAKEPVWEKTKGGEVSKVTIDLEPKVPKQIRTNFQITDDNLGAGGQKTKYGWNIAAIRLLNQLEEQGWLATPEEQEVLSRYVGWGGIPQVFDDQSSQWAKEYAELKELLDGDEYASARASTLNAHYTSPTVIKAMYTCLENMGFQTGNILEPACGIGNFFGLVPDSMKNSKLYGIELDSITGRIAKQLYQQANIAVQGFEETNLPDSFFDLAISNVPFGSYGVADKKYDKHKFYIHDYFFAKTLDKVRPGGIIAFITSKGTMDKQNPEVRKYIAHRAELLGAVRLPNNAFFANAGTEVTADILFFQKRDKVIDTESDWVYLSTNKDGVPVNQYFADNPDMVLGTMAYDDSMYGNKTETTCMPFENADLAGLLREALENIHAEITEYEMEEIQADADASIPADPGVRNFSYTIVDGKIYYRENSRMNPIETSVTAEGRIKGMIAIRDCVRDLIEYQTEDYSDENIREQQRKLNRLYDAFTTKYGLLNSRGNNMVFSDDSSYCLLCSLEIIDENGELENKADMFTKRTIRQRTTVSHVDTATEALAISIAEKASVDMGFMQILTGLSEEQLATDLQGVIFRNLGEQDPADVPKAFFDITHCPYVTADEYLSGNVRNKLRLARGLAEMRPDLAEQVGPYIRALEAIQPIDLDASEIDVRLGATWLPPDVIKDFIFELLETPYMYKRYIDVFYSVHTANWNVKGKSDDRSDNIKANVTYGTQRINGYKIIEERLNLRDVRIFDTIYEDGVEKRVLNKKETAIVQQKQEAIKEAFQGWIWKDPKRRERLTRIYNDRFNAVRPREYDGSHIRFTGMNPEISLRKHQVDAVAHILYGGNTLLAHCVGAGKTYEMTAAAMESKHLGLCNKSMFVVPNHLTEQWLRP